MNRLRFIARCRLIRRLIVLLGRFLVCHVAADCASARRAQHGMMAGHVPGNCASRSAFETPFRIGCPGYHAERKDQNTWYKFNVHHFPQICVQ